MLSSILGHFKCLERSRNVRKIVRGVVIVGNDEVIQRFSPVLLKRRITCLKL